jgi:hypothetical protein
MSLPTKDELLKEVVAVVEGGFEAAKNDLEQKANSLKSSYFKKVDEICASVSL